VSLSLDIETIDVLVGAVKAAETLTYVLVVE
jgi:hypothetical protein